MRHSGGFVGVTIGRCTCDPEVVGLTLRRGRYQMVTTWMSGWL